MHQTPAMPVPGVDSRGDPPTRPDPYKKRPENQNSSGAGVLYISACWTMPAEEADTQAEMHSDAVDVERRLHTGCLILAVHQASQLHHHTHRYGLGIADAGLYAVGYLWNEVSETWQKGPSVGGQLKLLLTHNGAAERHVDAETGVTTDSVTWDQEFQMLIPSGTYEANHSSAEVHGSFSPMEDLQHSALTVLFQPCVGFSDRVETGITLHDQGWHHGVEVYLDDTIEDFSEKVALACQQLAEHWERIGGSEGLGVAERYRSAVPSEQRVVLVFVPSDEQSKHMKSGSWGAKDYRAILCSARADPGSWQPLDPTWTFEQYSSRFGFGDPAGIFPPFLHVVEETEMLKHRNLRYRNFVNRRRALGVRVEDTDDERQVFAWARYIHKGDGGLTEWRPSIVSGPADDHTFRVSFLSASRQTATSSANGHDGAVGSEEAANVAKIEESGVLMAPAEPRILHNSVPQRHKVPAPAPKPRAKGEAKVAGAPLQAPEAHLEEQQHRQAPEAQLEEQQHPQVPRGSLQAPASMPAPPMDYTPLIDGASTRR